MKQATFQISNHESAKKEENVKHPDKTLETQNSKQITSIKPSKVVENVYYLTR